MRTDPDELLAGRYRLLDEIGRGGMGVVWRASDTDLDRTVAIKELRLPDGVDDGERATFYARLEREARAAARLKHPGIVTVHDRLTVGDRPWIVMEYVEGGSLHDLLGEHERLEVNAVAALGVKMLTALRAAHAAGVVHRDVKPANVLLEGDRVVLTDFGIATLEGDSTLTRSGAILGTPAFMAPEQVRGQDATPETDLWSLGATLYAAVEGQVPFGGASTGGIFVAIATEDPHPFVHAGPLAAVLTGLLDKDPAQRLNADDTHRLLTEVSRGAAPLPTRVAPPPPPHVPVSPLPHVPVSPPVPPPMPLLPTRPAAGPAGTLPPRPFLYAGAAAGVIVAALVGTLVLWPDSGSGKAGGAPVPAVATTPASSPPAYTPPAPAPATSYPVAPAHTPMSAVAINRVFKKYMNSLADHDMTNLRAACCPRLRSTLLGFALNGYYVGRWKMKPYTIPPGADQLSVEANFTQEDPDTGNSAGDIDNQWIIERESDGRYFVCGWLNYRGQ
ncbi:serine/threonine-protein kinase [Actinoallomurus sp. CA-150999]|uniref:serine/threonine-protein kinase n=1 Tax=Actinoallomurus sp. CA-150999 TaxID=3239887 RepID=UPI003D8C227C